jgi:hypothetical protein
LAGAQLQELVFRELEIEAPVEVLQRLEGLEVGAAQTLVELAAVAALDLIAEQAVEELGVRQVVIGGLSGAQIERFQNARQTQFLEGGRELVRNSPQQPLGHAARACSWTSKPRA